MQSPKFCSSLKCMIIIWFHDTNLNAFLFTNQIYIFKCFKKILIENNSIDMGRFGLINNCTLFFKRNSYMLGHTNLILGFHNMKLLNRLEQLAFF